LIRFRQISIAAVRLLAVPLVVLIWVNWLPLPQEVRNILMLVAVMPSAVSSVPVSEIFGADSEFAAASVLLTHLFCLLTVPLWFWLIGAV